jgi:methylphosphotriester-DNA--protein-cysteine methyltransferase
MQAPFITADQLLAELLAHVGKDEGIHVRDLVARITGLTVNPAAQERRVRTLITELRKAGHRICGKPESGYFMAATAEELQETCMYLRSRAISTLEIECRMRQVSMPDLLGQLKFSTDINS